jgi:hypoxanthine phosphoribosyltransferase
VDSDDIRGDITKVLLPEATIHERIAELCRQIEADDAEVFDGTPLLLVGVLKGAVMVMADIARELRIPVQMDWMAVSSYGSSTQSSGVVRILKDLDAPEAVRIRVDVKYCGFDIPNEFVIGYGLDYAESYRNLRDVAVLAPHVYE